MSYRITQDQIKQITNAAVESVLRKEADRLNCKTIEGKMFNLAYNSCFDKSLRRKLKSIPVEFLKTEYATNFSLENGESYYLHNYKKNGDKYDYVYVPMPYYRSHPSKFVTRGEAAEKIKAWLQEKEDFRKKENELRSKINAVLCSVSTFRQLKKIWPEGEKFYKDFAINVAPSKSGLPAPILTELNEMLGLVKKASDQ